MKTIEKLIYFLETLSGCHPIPRRFKTHYFANVLIGLWWSGLFLLVWAFVGRGAKFIYIDF